MSLWKFLEQHARERAGMDERWAIYAVKCQPLGGPVCHYYELHGSTCPPLTRGPNKGRRNWRKPEPGSVRVINIGLQEQKDWEQALHERTGICLECANERRVMTGWSAESGTRYRPCRCVESPEPATT